MNNVLPDSIGLRLPEMWSEYPLDEREFRAQLSNLVAEATEAPDISRAQVRQFEMFLVGVRDLALGANVILSSGFVDSEAADSSGQPIAGTVFVSMLTREDLGTDIPLTTDLVIASLARRAKESESQFQVDEIEPPKKVETAGLPAVKTVRLLRSKSAQQTLKVFVQSIFVPVANGEGVVAMQFGTPNVELASDFSDLFDAIADTLRVLTSDEPTFDQS